MAKRVYKPKCLLNKTQIRKLCHSNGFRMSDEAFKYLDDKISTILSNAALDAGEEGTTTILRRHIVGIKVGKNAYTG